MRNKFKVTAEHGRVKRQVSPGVSVLVAIPGDEIDYELAEELGLVKKPAKDKPKKDKEGSTEEPEATSTKDDTPSKPRPSHPTSSGPRLSGYAPKRGRAKKTDDS